MKTVISWVVSAVVACMGGQDFFKVLTIVSAVIDIWNELISHTDDKNALH
ncbi:MAG: hypothetical protein NC489_40040 [Ruminococcus flavefaciens]|nr:hypothetical protein [Ruminococcus flavefaciens]